MEIMKSNSLATVILRPGEADRVLAGHPWVYQGAILRTTRPPADGEVVQVKDHRHRLLGVGFYNARSKIQVRMLAAGRREIDGAFFRERIAAALDVRRRHLPEASSFRVVNAEGDFLSGLIVDKYEDVLVVQMSSLGMSQRRGMIGDVLQALLQPRGVIERHDPGAQRFEGMTGSLPIEGSDEPAPPEGDPPGPGAGKGEPIEVKLNGLRFELHPGLGHKTGLYLDQQENYRRVAELAKDASVLDCFSYEGGFALHAARAGAREVRGLDQSAEAVAAAERNAQRNGLADRCQFEAANVFDWLKSQTRTGAHEKLVPRLDLVVLDPPSFTRNRASVPDALRGYKEIHLRAMKLLKPGGRLATFCCSHHVDARMFQEVILEAAFDARRWLRRIAVYAQSPDHPVLPAVPETEYLKGFAFEVLLPA
ncbi:MAG: class I SAM-dependent rRNA methyltransferase [Verrucomicrobia bacterium]|nr:class I SAM-dependent rRNA methyltransferase [Verrucomicrobiota bacterium]